MSIFSRMTDIVNSNLNALLDKAEDPEKMVRLIIQEMEETLVEVRSTSARAIADRKDLERRVQWQQEEAGEWQRKAEVAVSKGRDDLAKSALVEAKKSTEQAESLHSELDVLNSTLAKLGDDISALQEKIKDAKARQNAIITRGKAAHSRLDVRRTLSDHNIDGAISRFEQYERKMDDLEGQIESYDLGKKSLADEISELEGDENVDAMLEDLKARMASTDGTKEQAAGGSVASKQDKQ
ncbi:MAG: phage shock protein PspA [Gammaproteobacteria bacterium]|nr:phage shock protein PspA [Gammaproteobacteria bacterium]